MRQNTVTVKGKTMAPFDSALRSASRELAVFVPLASVLLLQWMAPWAAVRHVTESRVPLARSPKWDWVFGIWNLFVLLALNRFITD